MIMRNAYFNYMRKYWPYGMVVIILVVTIYYWLPENEYSLNGSTIAEGQMLFKRHCMSCHGLQDEGIGPPLGGITKILTKNELVKFISHPQKSIEAGDARVKTQLLRYKMIMPSFGWMEEANVNAILSYIHQQSNIHHLDPISLNEINDVTGLTGRLAPPIKPSGLTIELKEIIQFPQLGPTTDLGVVTIRAHPAGDGTLLASDQNGSIYQIKDGKATTFLNIREYIRDFQSGPGIATGIGSFDFHPDYQSNGLIFISHAETYKGQHADYVISDSIKSEVQWVIGEWRMADVNNPKFMGSYRELLRMHAPTFGHGCQDVSFVPGLNKNDPDYGLLYFGYGDGGSNNIKHPELGHHSRSFLGSIMRIDPAGNTSRNGKYGIPPSNPFANESDSMIVKEIYAYGFRNPHRLAWDKENGNRMLATDIGESNIEELNIVVNAGDYGWPSREGSYGIATVKDLKSVFKLGEIDQALYQLPFAQYDHTEGNAISGGYVYEGDINALNGKYIFGDIVNGRLFYVNINPQLSDSTIYEIALTTNGQQTNLRELSESKRVHLRVAFDPHQKQMYIITKVDGKIYRMVKATQTKDENP